MLVHLDELGPSYNEESQVPEYSPHMERSISDKCSIKTGSFEFSHFKLVNEHTKLLLDTYGTIATCGQGFMYYSIRGNLLFVVHHFSHS